jgi:NitT/TauT family transport system permease protein
MAFMIKVLSNRVRTTDALLGILSAILIWQFVIPLFLPETLFPSPRAVVFALFDEIRSHRLWIDLLASLFRVFSGFFLALAVGIPGGLLMGRHARMANFFLPIANFARSTSTIAWIPFAVLWFGIGDLPVIFLVFIGAFFPILVLTSAAVANIPSVYLKVAHDYHLKGSTLLFDVILPAIGPQLITGIRMAAGLTWSIVVAAEMLAGRDGLGFAIQDARNGLRIDLLLAEVMVIGMLGIGIDIALRRLSRRPSLRWGYER